MIVHVLNMQIAEFTIWKIMWSDAINREYCVSETNELSKICSRIRPSMDQQLTRNGRTMQFVLFRIVPKTGS